MTTTPLQPTIVLCLRDLILALRAMNTGDGYHLNYTNVVQGFADWNAELCHEQPNVYVFGEETQARRGGERAGGSAFRTEDVISVVVHIKRDPAQNDLMEWMYRVRADLRRAALTDRKRTLGAAGRPNTFYDGTEFLYPALVPEGMLGGTVRCKFTIRWDHFGTSDATA